MDAATFQQNFPAFEAVDQGDVTYWLTLGGKLLNTERWADLLDDGLQLFAAHNLALEIPANLAGAMGGAPGVSSGPTASKTVDKVSVSYDTTAGIETDAGHWNLTNYGKRLIRLARMVGAGGMQF